MSKLARWARLYHTIRYLKPVQIYGRAWQQLYSPRPRLDPAPPARPRTGEWIRPIAKHAAVRGPNTFRFLNEERTLRSHRDWNNATWPTLWLYNLHYFDFLSASQQAGEAQPAIDLVARWIAENPPGHGIGWEPYPTSIRIVNWIKAALSGAHLPERALHSLAIQARFLSRRLETHLQGNHLIANGKALVFAGAFFEGPEASRWLEIGLHLLEEQLNEQILDDGAHFELSPMYHSIVLEDVMDLRNLMRAYCCLPIGTDHWLKYLEIIAGNMRNWLQAMCHPDGKISFFNDAAFSIAASPGKLDDYAKRLNLSAVTNVRDGITHLAQSGFIRIQEDELVAILDIGHIGPDYLPGHAHADTLSFELSLFGERVLVNSGISTYESGETRTYQRSTAAHNTVEVDGHSSSEVWDSFRVARRAYPMNLSIENGEWGTTTVRCSHDGFRRLSGNVIHTRTWRFKGRMLTITEELSGAFSAATAHYHIHPNVIVLASESPAETKIRLGVGVHTIDWSTHNARAQLSESLYYPEFGTACDNMTIITGTRGEFPPNMFSNRLVWK